MKKLLKKISSWFSFGFVHPILDDGIATELNNKLGDRRKKQVSETDKYNDILKSYLRTYFSATYVDSKEMSIAFDLTNRKWKELCKDVNRKNKLINIQKEAFANRVKLTIEQLKKNQNEL